VVSSNSRMSRSSEVLLASQLAQLELDVEAQLEIQETKLF